MENINNQPLHKKIKSKNKMQKETWIVTTSNKHIHILSLQVDGFKINTNEKHVD
jgi:hypothetical protein